MKTMPFSDHLARILVEGEEGESEDKGCTIIHFGATYPPKKVTCSETATDFIVKKLPRGKYLSVIISGEVNNQENVIIVTSIKPTSC